MADMDRPAGLGQAAALNGDRTLVVLNAPPKDVDPGSPHDTSGGWDQRPTSPTTFALTAVALVPPEHPAPRSPRQRVRPQGRRRLGSIRGRGGRHSAEVAQQQQAVGRRSPGLAILGVLDVRADVDAAVPLSVLALLREQARAPALGGDAGIHLQTTSIKLVRLSAVHGRISRRRASRVRPGRGKRWLRWSCSTTPTV